MNTRGGGLVRACKCSSDRPWSCHIDSWKVSEDGHVGAMSSTSWNHFDVMRAHTTPTGSLQLNLAAAYTGCRISPSHDRPRNYFFPAPPNYFLLWLPAARFAARHTGFWMWLFRKTESAERLYQPAWPCWLRGLLQQCCTVLVRRAMSLPNKLKGCSFSQKYI